MTREVAFLVMAGVAVVLLGLIAWGWWRRMKRDTRFTAPYGELPAGAEPAPAEQVFYVATTRHDEPLERLAIRGMTFRSRAQLSVSADGIALDLTGSPRIVIRSAQLVGADQATVAIDRVVEPGGLVRVAWRIDEQTTVDSYLRPLEHSARDTAQRIDQLATPTPALGGDQ